MQVTLHTEYWLLENPQAVPSDPRKLIAILGVRIDNVLLPCSEILFAAFSRIAHKGVISVVSPE